ncbi:hypothetical protein PGB90_002955 [Kerria lacca]
MCLPQYLIKKKKKKNTYHPVFRLSESLNFTVTPGNRGSAVFTISYTNFCRKLDQ